VHAGLSDLIARGALRTTVTETAAIDELPVALQRVADRAVVGKVVMEANP
jgi:NADPH:quinone reductase-like Zn-dependent oxidoreductase